MSIYVITGKWKLFHSGVWGKALESNGVRRCIPIWTKLLEIYRVTQQISDPRLRNIA